MPTSSTFSQPCLTALALVAMLASGCGKSAPTSVHTSQLPASAGSTLAPQPETPLPTAGGAATAHQILAAIAASQGKTRTWSAKAYTETLAPAGTKVWNLTQMYFRAPSTETATVISSSYDKSVGTKIIFDGGDQVNVKTYFFGFLAIKITLPVTDGRLVDANKHTLKDTETSQLMSVLLDPKATATYLGPATIKGETADMLQLHSPSSWAGTDHEIIGISRRAGVPISREVFDGQGRRLFYLALENMQVNYKPGADDFTL